MLEIGMSGTWKSGIVGVGIVGKKNPQVGDRLRGWAPIATPQSI